MSNLPSYREYFYSLAVGQEQTIHRVATSVACIEASGAFQVAFGDGSMSNFQQGLRYQAETAFNKTRIRNNGNAPITVKMALATGNVGDSRLSLTGVVQSTIVAPVQTTEIVPDTLVASGINATPMSRTLMAAADADRVEVILSNLGPSAVFLGGDTVSAGQGVPLNSGKALTLTTSAAIYAYNQTTTATPISILETKR